MINDCHDGYISDVVWWICFSLTIHICCNVHLLFPLLLSWYYQKWVTLGRIRQTCLILLNRNENDEVPRYKTTFHIEIMNYQYAYGIP